MAGKPRPDGPRPKPDTRIVPSPDEFDAWCEHPVTRFVAAGYLAAAEAQRDAWATMSWSSGHADPVALNELRTRADAYLAFLEAGLDRYVELTQDR